MATNWTESSFAVKLRYFLYSTPIEILVYLMILLSVGLLSMEVAAADLIAENARLFDILETSFTIFFVFEYVLKMLVAKDKLLHFRNSILDLLAILPFLRFFRLLRGIRILRLLRVVRLLRLGNMIARRISQLEGASNFREIIIIFVVFLATLMAGSIGILLFERETNEAFVTLGDGLWWSIVTLTTVGYGDKFPITTEGKILGAAVMLVGLSFYGLVAGLGSNFIINRLKKGGEWMVSTYADHAVVLGVNDKLDGIVNLLIEQGTRVVIITDDIDRVATYPENLVSIIEGDFIEPKILKKARVSHAAFAILLADTNGRSAKDADARSVLGTLAVEQIKPEIKTVVEALSEDTAYHLRNAGVDEIIVSGDLTAEMLAYSTTHQGYSKNLSALMRFAHRNRIVEQKIPERFEGKTIAEATAVLATERRILLAVRNPKGKESLDPTQKLSSKDTMIYVEIV